MHFKKSQIHFFTREIPPITKGPCTNNFTKLLSHDLVLPAIIQDNVRKLIAEEP
jgi:hypothetical protein